THQPYVTIARDERASSPQRDPGDLGCAHGLPAVSRNAGDRAARHVRRALRARPESECRDQDVDGALHRDDDLVAANQADDRARLAVERPSRVVMRYTDPDARVVLIDGNRMTMSWPGKNLTQVTDIAAAQGRVQKY